MARIVLFPKHQVRGHIKPPDSSPYYEQSIIGNVYAQTNVKESTVVLGDFNARVGKTDILDQNGKKYEYADICDEIQNAPGKRLINLCKEKSLVIANHLKYKNRTLGGNLSYKKR